MNSPLLQPADSAATVSGVKDGTPAAAAESRRLLTRAADALHLGTVARRVGDTHTAAHFFALCRSRVQQARATQ